MIAESTKGEDMPTAEQELVVAEPAQETLPVVAEHTPMSLIAAALQNGVEPDKLEKLMELQERWDANQLAKESRASEIAYSHAMSACQGDMGSVVAQLENKHTKSLYADLFAVDKAIRPVYTKHGFSVCAGTDRSVLEKHVHVYIDVRHEGGHSVRFEDDFPLDNAGINGTVNKTPIQAMASSTSYARRYLLMGAFNVAIERLDQDGNKPEQVITPNQIAILNGLMERLHPDDKPLDAMLKWAEVGSLDKLPVRLFLAAEGNLQRKVAEYSGSDQS